MSVPESPGARQFLAQLGARPAQEGWTLQITLSTVPMDYWFYQRNRLQGVDLQLSLVNPAWGNWVVKLERRDEAYFAQWREDDDLRVESEQLRYRKLTPWPRLASPQDFPLWVLQLEKVLGVAFLRHANVGARWTSITEAGFDDAPLRQWLRPCAESWGKFMQDTP